MNETIYVLGNFVKGEIFLVDEKMMGELDKLEDYPTWYDRELQDFDVIGTGQKEQAWVYIMKTFPEKMLSLPYLTFYKNSTLTPYKERSARLSNISAKDDLEYQPNI